MGASFCCAATAAAVSPTAPTAIASRRFMERLRLDDALDDLPLDERESFAAAEVRERELLLVEPELVEHRGVDVANVVRLLDRAQADRIGRADRYATLHTAPGQPHREPEVVVVAARAVLRFWRTP